MKGVTKEEQAARPDLVEALAERVEDIPEGITVNRSSNMWGGKAGISKPMEIKVDSMHPGQFFYIKMNQ